MSARRFTRELNANLNTNGHPDQAQRESSQHQATDDRTSNSWHCTCYKLHGTKYNEHRELVRVSECEREWLRVLVTRAGTHTRAWQCRACRVRVLCAVNLSRKVELSATHVVQRDNDSDNDNDTLREVPHLSNDGLALQARVSGPWPHKKESVLLV